MKNKKIPKSISATEAQWLEIQKEAKQQGMTVSAWLILHWQALKNIPPEKRFKIEIKTAG